MSRYMERADIVSRTLANGFYASYDISSRQVFNWSALVKIFCYRTDEEIEAIAASSDNVLRELLIRDKNNSLKELVLKARENARGAQEHLTKEVWESINETYHSTVHINIEKVIADGDQMNLILHKIDESLIYYGVFENTMPRGQGWNFMNLGRFVERSMQTLNFAEAKFAAFNNNDPECLSILYWKNLLLNLSGYELYLKSYRGENHMQNITDMIFLKNIFPRSITYSFGKIQLYIRNILKENNHPNNPLIERKTGALFSKIAYTDLQGIREKGVLAFIEELKSDLYQLSQLIGQSFFSYY
ncbi:hypothetical protein A8C56_08080 [Niabella ginsenosidivorans]|uniref:DUF403 domain-containing protein n=2 Tax=Niabella ginsenosidivorans TaxID=1176587 RepID=A0A1A9HZW5_9BACT|nr:hypothetical protein A8C56_08080 [Niabella ginsenosidivorans]